MIYIKRNHFISIFSLLIFATFQYVQLALLPIHYSTRPLAVFLIAIIFLLLLIYQIFYKQNNNVKLYYFNKKIYAKWIPIYIIFFLFFMFSLYNQHIFSGLKALLNLLVAFFFYWFGYTRLGFKKSFFIKLVILFSIPMFIVGYMELIGLKFFHPIYDFIVNLREAIVTVNFDKTRLHLLFSEPSFIATYAIFMFYIIIHSNIQNFCKYTLLFSLLVFVLIGGSLNNMIVISAFFISMFFLGNLSFTKKILITLLAIILIAIVLKVYFLNRILNLENDISANIRFLHIKVLWDMFTSSFGLGYGFGTFSDFFINQISSSESNILEHSKELQNNISGNSSIVPYSMAFSILGETGFVGMLSFLFLFKNLLKKSNPYKHYYIALLFSTITALPWGLPFIWITLGLLDRDVNDFQKK